MAQLKILVVDDEPGIRSGVHRILGNFHVTYPFMDEDYTFNILEAATGEEGIEIIDREMPDILLLDNKLPGIQGVEVLEYVRKKNYDIVVAMITSYASIDVAVRAHNDGAIDFIPKPFTPQELKASIEQITKQQYLRRITHKLKVEGRKVRFQFLSVLSHEMKAPLNAIEGYLKMMQERQMGDSLDEYSSAIERSLQRIDSMRHLIMDLLDFTKVSFERHVEKMQNVNLKELVSMAVVTVSPYAIHKDIQFVTEVKGCETIWADPNDFEIIMNNLVSNAVKYNRPGGTVTVTLDCNDNEFTLSVADTGIGMNSDEREMLFEEFSRIKNDKTRNISGSGLGLSIVRKVVDLYHGVINVESAPDKGSVFTVIIPTSQVSNLKTGI
ncbi:MAG: hybrid sensor histidine kinase/response regulator [Bacteroidales bacterium]|jgi:signal transduction histidine kinase|nr:hybrid sensor histidine kinase/response regulator [Bacteroidales bacterium]